MRVEYKKWIRHGYAKVVGDDVLLTIPLRMQGDQRFLDEMQQMGEKLQKKLALKTQHTIFSDGGVLLFGERVTYEELPSLQTSQQWSDFFDQELLAYAEPLLVRFGAQLGFQHIPLRSKKVESKRGSCTHDNRIMLNQSLVHLPTKYIQYVIIHEACHLVYKNHSKVFWELVEKWCPDYKQLRKALKNQIVL